MKFKKLKLGWSRFLGILLVASLLVNVLIYGVSPTYAAYINQIVVRDQAGDLTEVTTDGELEINISGEIDSGNSTTTPLGIGGVFTGTAMDVTDVSCIYVVTHSDVASATDGLMIQKSTDNVNWDDHNDIFTINADAGKTFSTQADANYFRVKYTNGATGQANFRLQTVLKNGYCVESSHRIQDPIVDDDDASLVKAVLSAKVFGDGFVNIQATESENLRVANVESLFSVAKGDVVGTTIVHKFGKHEDVPAAYEPLTIGGIYRTPQVSAATTLRVKAGNVDDDAGGTGARLITLEGVDETGAAVTEDIATNGTSAGAAGTITWLRTPRAYIAETGTYASAGSDSQAADIVIENSAGTEDWLTIEKPDIGRGQSQIGLYTVPLGKTAYVFSYLVTTDSNKAVDFLFFKREGILDTVAPYQARRTVVEEIGVQGYLSGSFEGGQKFTELTDIGWMVKAAATAQVTVDFEIVLVDN